MRAGKYKAWGTKNAFRSRCPRKTLGIIGLGRIGSAVAQRMQDGFDVKIIYYDLKRNEELEENLEWNTEN